MKDEALADESVSRTHDVHVQVEDDDLTSVGPSKIRIRRPSMRFVTYCRLGLEAQEVRMLRRLMAAYGTTGNGVLRALIHQKYADMYGAVLTPSKE